MDFSFARATYKYGIYLGLGLCLYTLFMWLTKLDADYYHIGQYLDVAIIVLPLGLTMAAIKQETQKYKVSILQRFGIAILIGLIGTLLYDPFLYLYHNTINPDWYNGVLNLAEKTMQAKGVAANEIAQNIETMRVKNAQNAGMFQPSGLIASVIIMPVLIGLISFLFVRNKHK